MDEKTQSKLKKTIAGIIFLATLYLVLTFPYWQEQVRDKFAPSTLPVSGPATSQDKTEPNLLVIENLGIKTPIIFAEEENEKAFQESLERGVVHYPGTAEIGEPGNAYIFGHSSDYIWARGDYKAIFARLPKIEKGDLIYASNQEGENFTYEVIETFVASPKDTHLLDQFNQERKLLTLQTSYPLGTALKRFIVRAELKN